LAKPRVGAYVGRFQPPHRGHIHAILYALSQVDELVIIIGSAQYSHEDDNPFTAGERLEMLRAALDEAGVDRRRYLIIPVSDTHVHSIWVSHVLAYTPRFDVVFTNEPLTARLFKEAGFEVRPIPFLEREKYCATEVRRRVLNSGDWEELVPPAVARLMKERGWLERMVELARTDNPAKNRLIGTQMARKSAWEGRN